MIWNARPIRIAVGLLLLVAGVVALLPSLTGYTSLDGTVNARITVVSAPIDGTVTQTPPRVGTPLPAAAELLGIRNDRIARTAEVQLDAELRATKERLSGIDSQLAKLARLSEQLQQRLNDYQKATIQNLKQEIAIRHRRILTASAQEQAAQADLVRKEKLGTTGIVAGASVEQARAASVGAENERNIATSELERLRQQLDSAERGIFVGEGRNDVPYSQQRLDEIAIQSADLQFRERDLKARIQQLESQLDQERSRNRALRYAVVKMPFEGVIWRSAVVEGSNVIAGNELMQALDCGDLFVDILVPEVEYDEIYPGREAEVRLLGRSDSIKGKVLSVRGSAAVVDDLILAAKPPKSQERGARIRIALDDAAIQKDYANFCQVGRSVQVRFKSRSLPLGRWLHALWFSIT
jgi:multidrug resistance efflux pump